MEKLIRYLRFIREAERLKNVLRTAYTSEGRHESTAEHSWRLALLAAVLLIPGLQGLFQVAPFTVGQLGAAALLAFLPTLVIQLCKSLRSSR